MSETKKQIIEIVQNLPDTATVDDVMEELYFKMQVDQGLKELDEGKGVPHKEVERRLAKWLNQ